MPKGMCLAEVTLNSETIKPVVLAIIELRFYEGISQLPVLGVTRYICNTLRNIITFVVTK